MRKMMFSTFLLFAIILSSCNSNNEVVTPDDNIMNNYNTAYEDSVLFQTTRGMYAPGIYIMNKNGSGMRCIYKEWFAYNARWSSDKKQIIFTKDAGYNEQNKSLCVMDCNGKNLKKLTSQDENVLYGEFSPDGKQIAYIEFNHDQGRIKVMNIDGTVVKIITDWYGQLYKLSWAPTSKSITFIGHKVNATTTDGHNLYYIYSDGSQGGEILHGNFKDSFFNASWSPDGTHICFSKAGSLAIYNINTKTINVISNKPGYIFDSSWSKDGNKIIFDSQPTGMGNKIIYTINTDGTNLQKVTDGSELDWNPCWYK